MKTDYNERMRTQDPGQRILLYIHGGAYYFGSVDEHRYQMQRHARKLKARVFAPRYRLAPQFPFPCGLMDCLAAYLTLLEGFAPSRILLAGDSAGGGMVLSLLVVLRDQGVPLPAGAILLSPWVDLTHSFPSVAGDGEEDYIPASGFHHRPSMAWPPPTSEDMRDLAKGAVEGLVEKEKRGIHAHDRERGHRISEHEKKEEVEEQEAVQGFSVNQKVGHRKQGDRTDNPPSRETRTQGPGADLSIELDGQLIEIIDQIQMYTTNQLLSHPLVSPVLQTTLGGLPPLLIQTGGGELLRDEQVYLAHKAANPTAYPPSDDFLDEHDPHRELLNKYPPTDVQLQVWDDLCHVPHTLSFTRPAKYMYRSVAQFGAWALAHAQKRNVEIVADDDVSIISTDSRSESPTPASSTTDLKAKKEPVKEPEAVAVADVSIKALTNATADGTVGRAGDPLPPFKDHMIRQRVDRHGRTYPLPLPAEIPTLHLDPASIGSIKPGPVRKWIARKKEWDTRFAKEKRAVQKKRAKEMEKGYDGFGAGEVPPPTALAGRRTKGMEKEVRRKGKSWGLAMWSGWGSKHDESTLERLEKKSRITVVNVGPGGEATSLQKSDRIIAREADRIKAEGDAEGGILGHRTSDVNGSHTTPVPLPSRPRTASTLLPEESEFTATATATATATSAPASASASPPLTPANGTSAPLPPPGEKVAGTENTFLAPSSSRPHNGSVAYPFKLRSPIYNASTATLDSLAQTEVVSPMVDGDGEGAGAKVVEDGVVRDADEGGRPRLETFVTAREGL